MIPSPGVEREVMKRLALAFPSRSDSGYSTLQLARPLYRADYINDTLRNPLHFQIVDLPNTIAIRHSARASVFLFSALPKVCASSPSPGGERWRSFHLADTMFNALIQQQFGTAWVRDRSRTRMQL